jgi:hypothetical protein
MTPRTAIAVIIGVIVLAGAYVIYARSQSPLNTEPVRQEFEWKFVESGTRPSGAPTTQVTLSVAGVEVPLGIYVGNCFSVAGSQWELLPREVTGAVCHWAGGGTEIGVFEEGGSLVLKEGEVEGDAETPGTRGNFVPLKNQPPL